MGRRRRHRARDGPSRNRPRDDACNDRDQPSHRIGATLPGARRSRAGGGRHRCPSRARHLRRQPGRARLRLERLCHAPDIRAAPSRSPGRPGAVRAGARRQQRRTDRSRSAAGRDLRRPARSGRWAARSWRWRCGAGARRRIGSQYWYDYIAGVVARTGATRIHDELVSGRLPRDPAAKVPRFGPILQNASIEEQQRVLGVIGRRYHARFSRDVAQGAAQPQRIHPGAGRGDRQPSQRSTRRPGSGRLPRRARGTRSAAGSGRQGGHRRRRCRRGNASIGAGMRVEHTRIPGGTLLRSLRRSSHPRAQGGQGS